MDEEMGTASLPDETGDGTIAMVEYIYDQPTTSPKESKHWQELEHKEGDKVIETLDQLKELLLSAEEEEPRLAFWSCVLGYCEALTTSKKVQRFNPYPIPIDALERLVNEKFIVPPNDASSDHRLAARNISNWIWSNVESKSNVKDEKHANSIYIILQGYIDGKSVDCFGAALGTVIGLRQLGFSSSTLTVSEDHAYESHSSSNSDDSTTILTCEVAIPGNTKAQKERRGQEIAKTFEKSSRLTTETSWLYMHGNANYCRTAHSILGAMLYNLNCIIDSKGSTLERNSEPLLLIKRELLWVLKDAGHLDMFPFALCELGWSEEHCTSERGEEETLVESLASVPVTGIELLYYEAIQCSKANYKDKQVYPYCYMGFFHKDGGQDGDEMRLAEALRYFSEAARVASGYLYEPGDTLYLTKTMTKLSEFIVEEILQKNGKPREWKDRASTVACAKWLISFYDYLLLWEENSGEQTFLPICTTKHKSGISKSFALLAKDIRDEAFEETPGSKSKRLAGTLGLRLRDTKVSIKDMDLTILAESGSRTRKRKKRY